MRIFPSRIEKKLILFLDLPWRPPWVGKPYYNGTYMYLLKKLLFQLTTSLHHALFLLFRPAAWLAAILLFLFDHSFSDHGAFAAGL